MSGLKIALDKCVGCGLCVKGCTAGALYMENRKVHVGDGCTLCSVCVDSCRFGALSIERDAVSDALKEYTDVWVFMEQYDGTVKNVGLELLGAGRVLADARGCKLAAVLLGDGVEEAAKSLVAYGADKVYLCDAAELKENRDDRYCEVIANLVLTEKPEMLLFGATGFGRSLAPRIAARLGTGLTADCTCLEIDPETGLLEQTRPAFGGNLMATIVCPDHRPQMATVRPGVMPMPNYDADRSGEIIPVEYKVDLKEVVELLETVMVDAGDSIADAKIIVSAGKGIGSSKNMKLVKRLAELLGGAYGVSRPLVDAGWAEYSHQIGQTGCSVGPDILIACGISGAVQHLAGIANAKTVIAINTDPQAPIFRVANYAVVGDCVQILQNLIQQLEAKTD